MSFNIYFPKKFPRSYRIGAKLEDGLRLLCLQLLPTGDRFPPRLTLMMTLTLTMRIITTLARRKRRAEKWISLSLSALLKIVEAKDKMGSVRRRRTLELPFNSDYDDDDGDDDDDDEEEREKKRWSREVGLSAMNILLTPGNTGQEYLEILEGGSRR